MKQAWSRSVGVGVVALGLLLGTGGQALADLTLWYSGDFNTVNGLVNGINTNVGNANVYDDFTVTGSGWTVHSVFSNDLMDFSTSSAEWEIRSGVSSGNGGTVVASGTSAATQVATGRSGFGEAEYTVQVSGLSISLAPGTYWLTVAPVDSGGGGQPYNTTTSGTNGVGSPINGNSFFSSSHYSDYFTPAGSVSGLYSPVDFSMGVIGVLPNSSVPEPSTFLVAACGSLMGTGYWWRKRRVRPAVT